LILGATVFFIQLLGQDPELLLVGRSPTKTAHKNKTGIVKKLSQIKIKQFRVMSKQQPEVSTPGAEATFPDLGSIESGKQSAKDESESSDKQMMGSSTTATCCVRKLYQGASTGRSRFAVWFY
jgi:hypothetical protein